MKFVLWTTLLLCISSLAYGLDLANIGLGQKAEYARDGDTALCVAPGDDEAIASAALRLLGDASLRTVLQGTARREAMRFSHEIEADTTAAMFTTIVAGT